MVSQRRWSALHVRARRLAYLLAGTALASASFAGDAAAVCNVNAAGAVSCVGTTTTTNTTNLNGATAASSDRIQNFNNGSNILATIAAGVTIDGFGLNLTQNSAVPQSITVFHGGLVTTSQAVAALQLNGNGGGIGFIGNGGSITNTGSGAGLVVTDPGAGGVTLNATGVSISGGTDGINFTTGTVGIAIGFANLIQANTGSAITGSTAGGFILITSNSQIIGGANAFGIRANSSGGALTITNNGAISSGFTAITAFSQGGFLSITSNGNITGSAGIVALSDGGPLTIANNGNITATAGNGITASSQGGGLSITGNGAITGETAIIANTEAGGFTFVSGGAVTGLVAHGISSVTGADQSLTLNHNVAGAAAGLLLRSITGSIGITNNATLTGGTNAISGTASGFFAIGNTGTINGDINITGSNVMLSQFDNSGIWNTGAGNSTYSGRLTNTGTLNALNGVGGQTINIVDTYGGGGTLRLDLTDRFQFGGTANLTGGTLNYAFLGGALAHSYVVLTSAGLGGTTFATTSSTNPNLQTSVTYTPTDVLVNILSAQLGNGSNLNQNQRSIATALNNAFNAGANLPAGVGGLFAFTGPALGNALTQVSGEVATGIQPTANLSMGMFLNAMLDPFVAGRNGAAGIGAPMGYAPQTPSRVVGAHEAFAADMPVKARPYVAVEPRWGVWSAAYGGANHTDGDPVVGSNNLNARVYGIASGFDYRVSRDTVIGVAGAAGQTKWGVANLGNGDSDVGQIGAYGSTRWNNVYLSAAVAFAWHGTETHRTVTVAGVDRLDAKFNATSVGGRVEGGYRYGVAQYGLTPYAAVQVQSLRTPNYGETASIGSNQFALTFASQTTTDTRSELGLWADMRFLFTNGIQTTLRGRAAWVHDFNPGSRINPAFQTLPGASFVIDGAAAPRDAALTSAVAEFKLPTGITLIGKVDGEFSGHSTTVAGTGTIKYAW